mmetsp:Transcript_30850/g.57538  ORF Transcript_30850/g.57538 Transcript_30850/m.57538 type:complete len:329 (-) Transcript_30850:99-1085(-)
MTSKAHDLLARISGGELICLDGATGTELQDRGVNPPWDATNLPAQIYNAQALEAVHDSYVNAGASVIIANTYAANFTFMGSTEKYNTLDVVKDSNIEGIRVAKISAEKCTTRPIYVAGSMSNQQPKQPVGAVITEDGPSLTALAKWPPPDEEYANYLFQAKILAEEGVDFIFLEMLKDKLHASMLVNAAASTGQVLFVGLTLGLDANGNCYMRDEKSYTVQEAIADFSSIPQVVGFNIMHCEVENMEAYITEVRRHWQGPLGVYPNQGVWIAPKYTVLHNIEHDTLIEKLEIWHTLGVSMFGGCCGFGPSYISTISHWIEEKNKQMSA